MKNIYWRNSSDLGSLDFYVDGKKLLIGNTVPGRASQSVLSVPDDVAERLANRD